VYTKQRIMSRARSFCRQEAGAAGDDLPARFRAARLFAPGERAPRAGDGSAGEDATNRRDDREERNSGERETGRLYAGGHVRRAEAASHFGRRKGSESRIQPPRICLHVPREDGGDGEDQGDERGVESMRSLYSAR